MFTDHVVKETEERIELANTPSVGLFIVILGVLAVLLGIYSATSDSLLIGLYIAIVCGGFFIWAGLKDLLVNETVIIDKGTKSVRIIKDSNIKRYSSVSELHFSDIQEVKTDCMASEDHASFYVDLITQGKTITIYSDFNEVSTEKLAYKIRKMVIPPSPEQPTYIPPSWFDWILYG